MLIILPSFRMFVTEFSSVERVKHSDDMVYYYGNLKSLGFTGMSLNCGFGGFVDYSAPILIRLKYS